MRIDKESPGGAFKMSLESVTDPDADAHDLKRFAYREIIKMCANTDIIPQPLDMLEFMFERQKWLQVNAFGADPAELAGEERKHFATAMALAINTEVAEAMQEIAWKPWAKTDHLNREAFIEELVDIMHFVMNLALIAGCSAHEFYEVYVLKSGVNVQRQLDGYTGLDKQKTSGKL